MGIEIFLYTFFIVETDEVTHVYREETNEPAPVIQLQPSSVWTALFTLSLLFIAHPSPSLNDIKQIQTSLHWDTL